jgi:hypothetical protein
MIHMLKVQTKYLFTVTDSIECVRIQNFLLMTCVIQKGHILVTQ